jgi:hypothetical protein
MTVTQFAHFRGRFMRQKYRLLQYVPQGLRLLMLENSSNVLPFAVSHRLDQLYQM